jgi:hypothetical protein
MLIPNKHAFIFIINRIVTRSDEEMDNSINPAVEAKWVPPESRTDIVWSNTDVIVLEHSGTSHLVVDDKLFVNYLQLSSIDVPTTRNMYFAVCRVDSNDCHA